MRANRDDGSSAPVLLALLALLVLGLGGVSADLWRVVAAHAQLTRIADAASIAGATALDRDGLYRDPADHRIDPTEATRRVCASLWTSGFHAACPGPSIEVRASGTALSVVIERSVALPVLGVLVPGGTHEVTVRASADVSVLRGDG